MLQEAGPGLDREVSRRLGEDRTPAAGYSTDPAAADRLISRLEERAFFVTWIEAEPFSYCTLANATGAGATRPLALCRAVVNLPDGRLLPGGKKPTSK
jgi:hypothetical protein